MNPNYNCPNCDSELFDTNKADYQCERCGAVIKENGDTLKVDREPDRHGSRVYTYELNHAQRGQDHE